LELSSQRVRRLGAGSDRSGGFASGEPDVRGPCFGPWPKRGPLLLPRELRGSTGPLRGLVQPPFDEQRSGADAQAPGFTPDDAGRSAQFDGLEEPISRLAGLAPVTQVHGLEPGERSDEGTVSSGQIGRRGQVLCRAVPTSGQHVDVTELRQRFGCDGLRSGIGGGGDGLLEHHGSFVVVPTNRMHECTAQFHQAFAE